MKCDYHPDNRAVAGCYDYSKSICGECTVLRGKKYYRIPCASKMSLTESAIDKRRSENTSGQGRLAEIPPEIRGEWNWGAFLLNWIWGLGNSVWIAMLCLIPFVGIIMAVVLGVRGNELAWQSQKWDSVEDFVRIQRNWAWGG